MRHLGLIAAALLAGCACEPTAIPVPVTVPGPRTYVPVPAELTAPCTAAPELRDGMTGGQLLEAARAWRDHARCRDAQVDGIKALQPP